MPLDLRRVAAILHPIVTGRCLSCDSPLKRHADMTTPLEKPIRRELSIEERPYTLTLTATGMKPVQKGKRNGLSLAWIDLVNGDAALAAALQASTTHGAS